ncbi:hypothetical protein CIB84_010165 [Bambusicola thoracicus]|uniref:Uncharacterized protein n=1 Tax=Bambusicola thoracicus TaxID=9083 RepID=A0A2P4SPM7_BAMTH|nr:hypothetical protein CIB84_010165 [Bambusicola thoracicus]
MCGQCTLLPPPPAVSLGVFGGNSPSGSLLTGILCPALWQNKAARHPVLLCQPPRALRSIGEKHQPAQRSAGAVQKPRAGRSRGSIQAAPRSHVNSCTSSPRIPLDPRGTASSTSPLQGVPVVLHLRCPPLTSWHKGLSPAGLAQFCSQMEPRAEEQLGGVGCAWLCSAPRVLACPAGRGVSETQGYVGWSFEPSTNDSHRRLLPI